MRSRVRAILVCCKEETAGIACEILKRFGQLLVVDARVKSAHNGADALVECEIGERERFESIVFRILRKGKGDKMNLSR